VNHLNTLEGSGFDSEDLADIAKGKDSTPKSPKVKFIVGEYSFSTTEDIYKEWLTEISLPDEALHALGFPISALLREGGN
jgi:hypothetical protein